MTVKEPNLRVTPLMALFIDERDSSFTLTGNYFIFLPGKWYDAYKDEGKYVIVKNGFYFIAEEWIVVEEGGDITVNEVMDPNEDNRAKITKYIMERNETIKDYKSAVKAVYGIELKGGNDPDVNPKKFNGKW